MKPSPTKVRDRMIGHLLKLDECHPSGKPILVANVRVWARAATLPSATATQKRSPGESRSRLSSGHSFIVTRQIAGPLTGRSRFHLRGRGECLDHLVEQSGQRLHLFR